MNFRENLSSKVNELKEKLMIEAKKQHEEFFLKTFKNNRENKIYEDKFKKWHPKFKPGEIPEENFSSTKKKKKETIFDFLYKKNQNKLERKSKICENFEKNHKEVKIEKKGTLTERLYSIVNISIYFNK